MTQDKQNPVDLDSFEGHTGSLPDEYQSLALIDSPVASGSRTYTAHDITNFVLKAENQAFQYGRIVEIKKRDQEIRQLRAENEALREAGADFIRASLLCEVCHPARKAATKFADILANHTGDT